MLLTIIFSAIGIILIGLQLEIFFNFKEAEQEFLPPAATSELISLEPIFLGLEIFMIFVFSTIIVISSINFYYLFKQTRNLSILFRFNIVAFLLIIIASFFLIALQPSDTTKVIELNNFKTQATLAKPSYVFSYLVLVFGFVLMFANFKARNNFGYLKHDYLLTQ